MSSKSLRFCTSALLLWSLSAAGACGGDPLADRLETVPLGTHVEIVRKDGTTLEGRLVSVRPDAVVIEVGERWLPVPRASVQTLRPQEPPATALDEPVYHQLTIPADTLLQLSLETPVASDGSRVEDRVEAMLRSAVMLDAIEALPAGTRIRGHVVDVQASGQLRGPARLSMRFHTLVVDNIRYDIQTALVRRSSPDVRAQGAPELLMPTARGPLAERSPGAPIVLWAQRDEVRLGPGATIAVRLVEPVTIRTAVPGSRLLSFHRSPSMP